MSSWWSLLITFHASATFFPLCRILLLPLISHWQLGPKIGSPSFFLFHFILKQIQLQSCQVDTGGSNEMSHLMPYSKWIQPIFILWVTLPQPYLTGSAVPILPSLHLILWWLSLSSSILLVSISVASLLSSSPFWYPFLDQKQNQRPNTSHFFFQTAWLSLFALPSDLTSVPS